MVTSLENVMTFGRVVKSFYQNVKNMALRKLSINMLIQFL